MAKSFSIWEKAILQVLENHNGLVSLSKLYSEVPLYIENTNSKDLNHTLRGYLHRLKTKAYSVLSILIFYIIIFF